MDEIPEEDGFYWVLLGPHKMNVHGLKENEYTIVELTSNNQLVKPKRYISFLCSYRPKKYTMKYFKTKSQFGAFIPITNPNEKF